MSFGVARGAGGTAARLEQQGIDEAGGGTDGLPRFRGGQPMLWLLKQA